MSTKTIILREILVRNVEKLETSYTVKDTEGSLNSSLES